MRENAERKGGRYLSEARLTIEWIDDVEIRATCIGAGELYHLGLDALGHTTFAPGVVRIGFALATRPACRAEVGHLDDGDAPFLFHCNQKNAGGRVNGRPVQKFNAPPTANSFGKGVEISGLRVPNSMPSPNAHTRPKSFFEPRRLGMDGTEPLQMLFRDACSVAARAMKEFQKRPLVKSQRGGDRPSPWFRVWDQSVQNAVRLARVLGPEDQPKSLDEELSELLADPERGDPR